MRLFYGKMDRRVTRDMVQMWSSYTAGACTLSCIEGHHLWPLHPTAKRAWLEDVAQALASVLMRND
eukprot:gene10636-10794_t